MEKTVQTEDKINLTEIDRIVKEIGKQSENVIAILQAVQDRYNYLPHDALQRICDISDITPKAITGVATFYSQFRLKPAGRHFIKVCIGTACHVRGGARIVDTLSRELHIKPGETTNDLMFTLETVNCLGCCAIGPTVVGDGEYYGHMTANKAVKLLKSTEKEHSNG